MLLVFTVKPGDVVNIYEDPWQETKVEGKAKLLELLQKEDEREYWLVQFEKTHEKNTRWIKTHGNPDGMKAATPAEVYARLFPTAGEGAGDLCTRLQNFIADEDIAVEIYRTLMRELRESDRPDLAVVAWRISEDERRHKESLMKVKEALCPAA